MVTLISIRDALHMQNAIFVDSRTPAEFQEDCLPQAINIPLLSNEERAIVGTTYVQISQETAIEQGMAFFKKNLPFILKAAAQHKDKTLLVYCWRGGLRSKTLATALEDAGYTVYQIQGGYKAYRLHVKELLDHYKIHSKFIVLYGLTGCRKTALLQRFAFHIDLEALAGHRGSVYGGIGLQQHTQKKFENLLWQKLEALKSQQYILVEGESKRIGNCYIPDFFWQAMQQGIHVHVTCSLPLRVSTMIEVYFDTDEKRQQMSVITAKLTQAIPHKKEILDFFNNNNYAKGIELLLTTYYDPLYLRLLDTLHFSATIATDNVDKAQKDLQEFIHQCSLRTLHSPQ